MERRSFIKNSITGTAFAVGGALFLKNAKQVLGEPQKKFRLKYAPHFNMFKNSAGKDLIDQVKFIADQGFSAIEDNGMMKKDPALQTKIAEEMTRLNLTMGVFVAYADFKNHTFVNNDRKTRRMLVDSMKKAVTVAKRVNAKWCTVVPGAFNPKLEWDYQTANAIDNLKACAEVLEPAGLIAVLEPLNPWKNHPGCFLTKVPQAYQICKAVGSKSIKILDDLYHQQITEGNLIPNMEKAWDEIAYIQVGDNPGRKEPTTGEINYKNIFQYLYFKKYKGVIGMEHGNSIKGQKGEEALIKAYRECDSYDTTRKRKRK